MLEIRELEDAGRTSGLEVVRLEIRGAEDIEPAIETVKGRADALICRDRAARKHEPYAH